MSVPGTVNFPTTVDDNDSLFRVANDAKTTLNQGSTLSAIATAMTVLSTASFAASGAITLENEVIYYTGKTSNTFTGLLRGQDGTLASAHADGVPVEGWVIAAHHTTVANAIIAGEQVIAGPLVFNVVGRYGADRTGAADMKTAMDNAIADAAILGGIVWIPPGAYTDSGSHTVPANVFILGAGDGMTVITHTGNNAWVTALTGASIFARKLYGGFRLEGNAGASAVGFHVGNTFRITIRDATIRGYSNGIALWADNTTSWTEGLTLERLHLRTNLVGIRLTVQSAQPTSFANLSMHAVSIEMNSATAIGWDIGANAVVYGGAIEIKGNIENAGATLINVASTAQVTNNHYVIYTESTGGGTTLVLPAGAIWTGTGAVSSDVATLSVSTLALYAVGAADGPSPSFSVGHGDYVIQTATRQGVGDGELILTYSLLTITGECSLLFVGGGRRHYMRFAFASNDFDTTPEITMLADYAYGNTRVIGRPYFKRLNSDGSTPHLIVSLSNRNGGTQLTCQLVTTNTNARTTQTPPILPAAAFGTLSGTVDTGIDSVHASEESTLQTIAGNGVTINTAGITSARVTAAAGRTGAILQAGIYPTQTVTVIHEGLAANTITFAASGTSNVADGTSDVITGPSAAQYTWDSGTSLWYRRK